ncbi:cytochrome c [Roseovarius sp. Pro17]|uniref:c-type cytochrome n=1 Tax=Roseovarius sp. Pro17 TaxID=3108175 RepID=UPI002D77F898|nr:cytochrome c [Roseovarius sp. Pro17]
MNKALIFTCCASASFAAEPQPDAEALEHLVRHDCGSCHGMTLKGGLGPDIRAKALHGYDPETLGLVIKDGIPGTAMPPWRPLLTQSEIDWVVDYLLTGGE